MQDEAYREATTSLGDRWDGMAITNRAWHDHAPLDRRPDRARLLAVESDWDDRWRTGGTVDEVIDEAHLGPTHIVAAIQRFVDERDLSAWAACAKSRTPPSEH